MFISLSAPGLAAQTLNAGQFISAPVCDEVTGETFGFFSVGEVVQEFIAGASADRSSKRERGEK